MFWLKVADFFKGVLASCAEFFKKLWEGLKKTPSIVLGFLGATIGIGIYLLVRYRNEKEKAEATRELVTLERDHSNKVIAAEQENDDVKKAIKEDFENKKTVLEKKIKKVEEDIAKGPTGIADAWNRHLSKGEDK